MRRRTIILSITGLLIVLYFIWGLIIGLSPGIRIASSLIAINNSVKSEVVGLIGYKPLQYRFYELLKTGSDEELIKLLDSKSEAVQCYSFLALSERNYVGLFNLLKTRLNYTNPVKCQSFDILYSHKVSDYFLFHANFSENEQHIIDSILIFENIEIQHQKFALQKVKPNLDYYLKIKELAVNNNPDALIALSKFQKQKDIAIIRQALHEDELLYSALWAVREFPDTLFLDSLIDVQKKKMEKPTGFSYSEIRIMYQALIQFENPKVYNLFLELIDNYNSTRDYETIEIKSNGDTVHVTNEANSQFNHTYEYHTQYLWLSLNKYKSEYFAGFLESINIENEWWWKDEVLKQINYE